MRFKVEGAEKLTAKLNAIPDRAERNTRSELSNIGDDINDKSAAAAPLDTGALRSSVYKRINDGPGGPELDAGFEGLPYIIPMHERGWLNFMGRYGPKRIEKYHGGGGEKFLERPWLENKPRYSAALNNAVKRGVRG
jgi:hypothetical protein